MGKTLLKMQMSTATMVLDGKETTRRGRRSKHVHVQGMWFKSLDLKTTSPEKLAIMEFPENFLCPTKGLKSPSPNVWKLQWCNTTDDGQSSRRGRAHVSSIRLLPVAQPLAAGGSAQTAEVSGVFARTGRTALNLLPVYISNRASRLGKFSKQ